MNNTQNKADIDIYNIKNPFKWKGKDRTTHLKNSVLGKSKGIRRVRKQFKSINKHCNVYYDNISVP
jgi:hypothetical protein